MELGGEVADLHLLGRGHSQAHAGQYQTHSLYLSGKESFVPISYNLSELKVMIFIEVWWFW